MGKTVEIINENEDETIETIQSEEERKQTVKPKAPNLRDIAKT